jgi:hypothetical protein
MTMNIWRRFRAWRLAGVAACAVAGLVAPLPASAQETPQAAGAAAFPKLRAGQAIWATTDDGREWKGRIVAVTPDTVDLRDGGTTTLLRVATIRRIETPDRVGNGARNGAITGAAIYGGTAIGFVVGTDCLGESCDGVVPFLLVLTGSGAALGALAGLVVDALIPGRDVVYQAPPRQVAWRVQPIVTARRSGVAVTIRW